MQLFHKTTINFHITTMWLLNYLSKKTGRSRREIIINILNKLALDKRKQLQIVFTQISYQGSDPGKKNWHKFHIKLKHSEYEYFLDARHLFRKSSSYLISAALWEYYEMVLDGSIFECFLLLDSYAVESFFEDDVQSWVQHWGIPSRLCGESDNYPPDIK